MQEKLCNFLDALFRNYWHRDGFRCFSPIDPDSFECADNENLFAIENRLSGEILLINIDEYKFITPDELADLISYKKIFFYERINNLLDLWCIQGLSKTCFVQRKILSFSRYPTRDQVLSKKFTDDQLWSFRRNLMGRDFDSIEPTSIKSSMYDLRPIA